MSIHRHVATHFSHYVKSPNLGTKVRESEVNNQVYEDMLYYNSNIRQHKSLYNSSNIAII